MNGFYSMPIAYELRRKHMLRKNEAKSRKEISFKAFNNLYISKIKEEDDISSDGDNTPQRVNTIHFYKNNRRKG